MSGIFGLPWACYQGSLTANRPEKICSNEVRLVAARDWTENWVRKPEDMNHWCMASQGIALV